MWYRFAKKFIKIANEYWFHDNNVEFADGSIVDKNHEMIAEDFLIREKANLPYLFEYLETVNMQDLNNLAFEDQDFLDFLMNTYNYDERDAIDNAYGGNYLLWLMTGQIENPTAEYTELISALKDPRKYMVDNRGWIRVVGNVIETYNLDQKHLHEIISGLYEVYGEEAENMKFEIEITSLGKWFENVPFHELETGQIRNRLKEKTDVAIPKLPQTNQPSFYKYQGG